MALRAHARVAELHGTGTALGDPIEVGALRGVMKRLVVSDLKAAKRDPFFVGKNQQRRNVHFPSRWN